MAQVGTSPGSARDTGVRCAAWAPRRDRSGHRLDRRHRQGGRGRVAAKGARVLVTGRDPHGAPRSRSPLGRRASLRAVTRVPRRRPRRRGRVRRHSSTAARSLRWAHRAGEQRRRRRRRTTARSASWTPPPGTTLRVNLTAPMWLCAGGGPAHGRRRPRFDHQHLVPAGRARQPRAGRVYRKQGRAQRAHLVGRGRLRRSPHPLQHHQPRVRPQRAARCRARRRSARTARGHAPDPPRPCRRRRLGRGVPGQP